jgi:CRP-like cAMP-binding protein
MTFLDSLTDRSSQRLEEIAKQVPYPAGSNIVNEGDPAPPVYIVKSGVVKVQRTAQGDSSPMIVDLGGPGDVLGVEDCLIGRSSHVAFVAAKPVEALEIAQRVFAAYLRENPQAMGIIGQILASRVRLRDTALAYSSVNVRSRLTAFLARQQVVHGVQGKDGVVIDIGLNQSDIASAIGASVASVGAEMVKLSNEGYIATGYKTIYVKKQLREDAPRPIVTAAPPLESRATWLPGVTSSPT